MSLTICTAHNTRRHLYGNLFNKKGKKASKKVNSIRASRYRSAYKTSVVQIEVGAQSYISLTKHWPCQILRNPHGCSAENKKVRSTTDQRISTPTVGPCKAFPVSNVYLLLSDRSKIGGLKSMWTSVAPSYTFVASSSRGNPPAQIPASPHHV